MDVLKDNQKPGESRDTLRCVSLSPVDRAAFVLSGFVTYTKWRCVLCKGHGGLHQGRDGSQWGD